MSTLLISLKYWLEDNQKRIFWTVTIILVFFLGFGLGYQAGRGASRAPIVIEKNSE